MVKKEKIIENIIITTFVILITILIFQLILKLTGHSPTEIQLLYISLGCIITFLLGMTYKIAKFIGSTEEFMKNVTKELKTIKTEMIEMKKDIKANQENITKILLILETQKHL